LAITMIFLKTTVAHVEKEALSWFKSHLRRHKTALIFQNKVQVE
jgi:hypothetical protein